MGPSGSGKSTLLQLAAGLDRLTAGQVRFGDLELGELGEKALARLRRERIGFVFQSFNLLAALTAEQNVGLPARLAGQRLRRSWCAQRSSRRPGRARPSPSGPAVGRPAAARGDRPGARRRARRHVRRRADGRARLPLGPRGARAAARHVDDGGRTLVMVTHDPSAAAWADRVVFMADGRLAGELLARPPRRSPSA